MDFNREIHGLCDSIVKEAEAIKDYTRQLDNTQSEDLRTVYTNNRMDELPHIQNLVIALTAMLNGEAPFIASQMDENDAGKECGDAE